MFARVCCFFLIALAGGYGSVWAEGSAWQASGPAGPGASVRAPSHPAEDGLYSRLKKMPYLYDNKDAEFLNQFNTFSIYQILPQLIELWGLNVQTEVESRKNLEKVSGK